MCVFTYIVLIPLLLKAVLVNSRVLYHFKVGHGKSFLGANGDTRELYKFALQSVLKLKQNNPSAIIDGLVRVDVMCTQEGKMIVNEFEGLEASYEASLAFASYQAFVYSFLVDYWLNQLELNIINIF